MKHDAWNRGFDAFVDACKIGGDVKSLRDEAWMKALKNQPDDWFKGFLEAETMGDKIRAGLDHSHAKERHSE